MRVKNVSSTNIPLPEFNLDLKPGDVGDLSPFDIKLIHSHKLLSAYLEKGLLVNLGIASPIGSKTHLKSARDRIAQLKIGEYIPKQTKRGNSPNRAKIAEALKKNDSRSRTSPSESTERYGEEFHSNMNPLIERANSSPKPRPKIQETFKSMQVNPDGVISQFGSYGMIPTEVLTGGTTHLTIKSEDSLIIKDKGGNEYNVSLANIQEKLQKKCIGSNKKGKLCGKWAVTNFNSCLTHMSRTEKREYEALKRNGKSK